MLRMWSWWLWMISYYQLAGTSVSATATEIPSGDGWGNVGRLGTAVAFAALDGRIGNQRTRECLPTATAAKKKTMSRSKTMVEMTSIDDGHQSADEWTKMMTRGTISLPPRCSRISLRFQETQQRARYTRYNSSPSQLYAMTSTSLQLSPFSSCWKHQRERAGISHYRNTAKNSPQVRIPEYLPHSQMQHQQQHGPNQCQNQLSPSSLSASLISSTDAWGNWMVLLGNAAVAPMLGRQTKIGQLLGAPVTAMAMTFFFATVGILPSGGTAASQSLQQIALQIATPLVLLGAQLRPMKEKEQFPISAKQTEQKSKEQRTPLNPMVLSFFFAAVATCIAGLVGWQLVGTMLTNAFSPLSSSSLTTATSRNDGLILAAALLAKNIGGGLNYMAVCSTLQASPLAMVAGLCVDNIFALLYFPATSIMAAGHSDPNIDTNKDHLKGSSNNGVFNSSASAVPSETTSKGSYANVNVNDINDGENASLLSSSSSSSSPEKEKITVEQMTATMCVSAALLYAGQKLSTLFSESASTSASLPLCTLLTVLVARFCPEHYLQQIRPTAEMLGTVALYVFFSTAGAPGLAVAESVRTSLVPLTLFLSCIYTIHGGILWALYKLHTLTATAKTATAQTKVDSNDTSSSSLSSLSSLISQSLVIPRLLCASSAAIGGPATAVALAGAAKWDSLKVPSLLVGNLGYAVATFLGLAYHAVFAAAATSP